MAFLANDADDIRIAINMIRTRLMELESKAGLMLDEPRRRVEAQARNIRIGCNEIINAVKDARSAIKEQNRLEKEKETEHANI